MAAADAENALPAPTAIRTTSSTAIRKGPALGGAKRTNILGAKKGAKLGAKKVTGEEIDFDAAEKAAKAEAERIEKLGYDPEAEAAEAKAKSPTLATSRDTAIVAPTPISPPQAGYGNKTQHQKTPSEVERLGMGMGRLGFGQVGKSAQASTAPAPKKLGFGSVGSTKAAAEGKLLILERGQFLTVNQMTVTTTLEAGLALRKVLDRTNSSAAITSTLQHSKKPNSVCKALMVPLPSLATPTLDDQRMT